MYVALLRFGETFYFDNKRGFDLVWHGGSVSRRIMGDNADMGIWTNNSESEDAKGLIIPKGCVSVGREG